MASLRQRGLTLKEQAEFWRRWRDGESLSDTSRALGKPTRLAEGAQPSVPRPVASEVLRMELKPTGRHGGARFA